MILRQFLHSDPVGASYLFGCGGKAAGAVVDPMGDIASYLDAAKALGMRILFVIDTHLHADHVSSGRALAEASGADYVLFAGAETRFPFRGVKDGDVLELGNVTITALHTPGHTPESLSLLVTDRTRSAEPWFVLTGHTLMVGDMGRTELATRAEDGMLVFSVTDRGRGIDPEVAEKLFAPFFTTKEEGMGMGLNICRSIAELHRGRLSFEPNPDGGTIFRFTLPVPHP